jgi:hypothetical protein
MARMVFSKPSVQRLVIIFCEILYREVYSRFRAFLNSFLEIIFAIDRVVRHFYAI